MLSLRTFGGLSLTGVSGSNVPGLNVTRLSLLSFIAAHGEKGVRRDTIFLTFWGDSDQERARNALKQAVFALRKCTGRSDLLLGGDQLRINAEAIQSDMAQFRATLDANDLEGAVKLYNGDFLEGVHVRGVPEFEQWLDSRRDAFRDEYQSAVRKLAQNADSAGKVDEAVRYWKLFKASAPLESRAALGLVRALHVAGDRAGAMLSARQHEAALQSELGITADPEFGRSVAAIMEMPVAVENHLAPLTKSDRLLSVSGPPGRSIPPIVPTENARRKKTRVVTAGMVGAIVAALAAFHANQGDPRPTRALVIAFDNKTGNPSLDAFGSLVADFAAGELAASGLMPVLPTLNTLSTSAGAARKSASVDLAMKAVTTDGFNYAVGGFIYRSKDSITITPVVTSSRTGGMLGSLRPIRVAAVDFDGAAERVAQMVTGAIASEMDERVSTLRVGSERAPRYDAYVQFTRGLELFHDDKRKAAFDAFSSARALDSSFVLPILWQAFAVNGVGALHARDSLAGALSSYDGQLSPIERYGAAFLRADIDGDRPAALRAALRAATLAPGSNWSYIAATQLSLVNRSRQAVKLLSSVRPGTWVGNWPAFWRYYVATAHRAGNDVLAYQLIRQAAESGVSRLVLLRFHALLEAAAGSDAGVTRDYQDYTAITQSRDSLMLFFAIAENEAGYHGHPSLERKLGDSLIRYVAVPSDTSIGRVGMLADAYATVGRNSEAWPLALRYRAKSNDTVTAMGLLGLIAARTNRRAIAISYIDSLASARGGSKGERTLDRARIAAAIRDTATAMTLLRQAYSERGQVMWQHNSDFEELRGYPEIEMLRYPEAAEAKRPTSGR